MFVLQLKEQMYYTTEGSDTFPGFQQAKKQEKDNKLAQPCSLVYFIFRETQSFYTSV